MYHGGGLAMQYVYYIPPYMEVGFKPKKIKV